MDTTTAIVIAVAIVLLAVAWKSFQQKGKTTFIPAANPAGDLLNAFNTIEQFGKLQGAIRMTDNAGHFYGEQWGKMFSAATSHQAPPVPVQIINQPAPAPTTPNPNPPGQVT